MYNYSKEALNAAMRLFSAGEERNYAANVIEITIREAVAIAVRNAIKEVEHTGAACAIDAERFDELAARILRHITIELPQGKRDSPTDHN